MPVWGLTSLETEVKRWLTSGRDHIVPQDIQLVLFHKGEKSSVCPELLTFQIPFTLKTLRNPKNFCEFFSLTWDLVTQTSQDNGSLMQMAAPESAGLSPLLTQGHRGLGPLPGWNHSADAASAFGWKSQSTWYCGLRALFCPSHHVAQGGPELWDPLPHYSNCWDYCVWL